MRRKGIKVPKSKEVETKGPRRLSKPRGRPKEKSLAQRKESRFIEEFLIDSNGKRAAIAAGYSEKTAAAAATNLLRKTRVRARVRLGLLELREKCQIDAIELLKRLTHIASTTPMDFFKIKDGKLVLRNLNKIPEWLMRCVETVETTTEKGKQIVKLRLTSKLKALEMIGRHLRFFKDGLPTDDNGNILPIKMVEIHTMSPKDRGRDEN